MVDVFILKVEILNRFSSKIFLQKVDIFILREALNKTKDIFLVKIKTRTKRKDFY